ncbi:enoyl-CoA hydratase [Methylocystis sp. ATCC 49242]|uniref:enoyl-CoA hydratase n=1 Tax=Methylocystis sp. ATCC 49242 TaxID=622637 RepID=UPI0001F88080|nr:enoyl-CoA hydratase [Methylocystis sp. ATCC 49242]
MTVVFSNDSRLLLENLPDAAAQLPGVRQVWMRQHDAIVLSKTHAGFDKAGVETISALLGSITRGEYGALKFLIFDFAHGPGAASPAAEGFAAMVAANAELIVDTPVITLAWARSLMSGADFDFAMHCSAIVAEAGAKFSFEGEPFELFGLYAALGRRIGFVKTERLIESDSVIGAEEARELMIVKDVVEPQPELAAIDAYLRLFGRRYNASHAIFRAERMAQPPIDRRALDRR